MLHTDAPSLNGAKIISNAVCLLINRCDSYGCEVRHFSLCLFARTVRNLRWVRVECIAKCFWVCKCGTLCTSDTSVLSLESIQMRWSRTVQAAIPRLSYSATRPNAHQYEICNKRDARNVLLWLVSCKRCIFPNATAATKANTRTFPRFFIEKQDRMERMTARQREMTEKSHALAVYLFPTTHPLCNTLYIGMRTVIFHRVEPKLLMKFEQ